MSVARNAILVPFLTLLLLNCTGCLLYRTGDLDAVRTTSDRPRAGNVYLVRGLLGPFSTGLDDVASKLQQHGIRAHVYQDAQTGALAERLATTYRGSKDHEPLILVGHSLGADDVITVARRLDQERVPVDLLVTLDAVKPAKVPANVRRAVNLYKSNGAADKIPAFRGIPIEPERPGTVSIENCDLHVTRKHLDTAGTITHFNIDDTPTVQDEVVREILPLTPDRQTWAARRTRAPELTRATTPRPPLGQ